jgi:hypothetical protein
MVFVAYNSSAEASAATNALVQTSLATVDRAQQLSSCDPGEGFESGARFGVAREIARLRTVELAA